MSDLTIRELVIEHRRQSHVRLVAERDSKQAWVEIERIEKEIAKALPVDAHTYRRVVVVEDPAVMVEVLFQNRNEGPWIRFSYPDPDRPGQWTESRADESI